MPKHKGTSLMTHKDSISQAHTVGNYRTKRSISSAHTLRGGEEYEKHELEEIYMTYQPVAMPASYLDSNLNCNLKERREGRGGKQSGNSGHSGYLNIKKLLIFLLDVIYCDCVLKELLSSGYLQVNGTVLINFKIMVGEVGERRN